MIEGRTQAPHAKTCSNCGGIGHYRNTCRLDKEGPENIARAAALRERIDQLSAILEDHRKVRNHIDKLIADEMAAIELARNELTALRGRRDGGAS